MPDPITAPPAAPSRSAPSTFSALADAFIAWFAGFVTQLNAVVLAMNWNALTSTSTTSDTIALGSTSLTVDVSKSYLPGHTVKIARTSSPSNWMHGDVTSYNSGTGALVVNVTTILGSGTYTDWTITFSAPIASSFASAAEILAGTEAAKTIAPDTLKAVRAVDAAFWGIKNLRLVQAKVGDATRVQVNPDAMNIALNIGDHYHVMTAAVDVDAVDNLDTGALAAGTDYYIYACTDGATLSFKVSANSTNPTGFDAAHSRKIGGFHTLCVAVGAIAGHTLAGYAVKDILPASVWCLKHRTRNLVNAGMVYSSELQIWIDIYISSGSSGASVYNAEVHDTHSLMDHIDFGKAGNKRLPNDPEFQIFAFGTPEAVSIAGAADPVTTGGHNNSAGSRIISNIGCEDCCGCWWQWLDPYFGAYGLIAGGNWTTGASSGSRYRYPDLARTNAYTGSGARFVAEPL